MTQEEFKTKLDTIGLPVAYDHAKAGTKVPFINYTWHKNSLSFADDKVYTTKFEISIELVCNSKGDLNTYSDLLENVLDSVAPWVSTEAYSDEEQIYIKTYELEV